MRSSILNTEREKHLNASLKVTPRYASGIPNYMNTVSGNMAHINTPSPFNSTGIFLNIPILNILMFLFY